MLTSKHPTSLSMISDSYYTFINVDDPFITNHGSYEMGGRELSLKFSRWVIMQSCNRSYQSIRDIELCGQVLMKIALTDPQLTVHSY